MRAVYLMAMMISLLGACDSIPIKETAIKTKKLNTEILEKNKSKIESCFAEDQSKRKINFFYRIGHVPMGFSDIFWGSKSKEGCIHCFKDAQSKKVVLNINIDPPTVSGDPLVCLTNLMHEFRFEFGDSRHSFEDVNVQLVIFDK